MREGFDKEIDSLLRRRAGALAEARGVGARSSQGDAHLDADELSAFAEGALPVAARASAASHLADCDECRGLAVNLMRASGVEAALEKQAAVAQAPAKGSESNAKVRWLSAIFSPRVLRYAAPALAVCLIAAVSFVALRSRNGDLNVALQAPKSAEPQVGIESRSENAVTTDTAQPSANMSANMSANANSSTIASEANGSVNRSTAGNSSAATRENKEAAGGPPSSSPSGAALDDTTAPPAPPSKASDVAGTANAPKTVPRESGEDAKAEEKAKAAGRNDTENELATEQPSQQQQQLNGVNNARGVEQSPDGSRKQNRSAANNAALSAGAFGAAARNERDRSGAATSAPAARRSRAADEPRKKETDEADKDEVTRTEDTRSAAGHRFRREGSTWVDVNYKPSMSSTGVRRGTDAFRSLVSDIPELARIAEELRGEIIVVVHGRAYHIR